MFDKPVDSTFEDAQKIIAIGKIDYKEVEDKSGASLSKKEIAELAKAMKAACANAKKDLKK